MELLPLVGLLAGVQLTLAAVLFLLSLLLKRNDIADIAWGPGVALAGTVGVLASLATLGWPHYLLLAFVWLWALRLGIRIGRKNWRKGEDARYQAWREAWGKSFYLRSFLQVFVLQSFLMPLIALSVIVAGVHEVDVFTPSLLTLGAVVWVIGFVFEVIGDWQLDAHINDPARTGLMRTGLWRYSRHPNYFGEITMWWGLWLTTLSLPLPFWLVASLSPITITALILFVSGIPMLEKQMEKYEGWAEYKKKTSVLVPWWPRP